MAILTTPTLPNVSNPLSGISQTANNATKINNLVPNKKLPMTNVAGLPYKTPKIDCAKFPLLSLDTIPCPELPPLPKPPLPTKQEITDRINQFIPNARDFSVPGVPSLPEVPLSNLPKLDIPKLPIQPCPNVPTLEALNPFPAYKNQVKLWLNEPITLPNIKDLLPSLPQIPKPPYFTLPCNSIGTSVPTAIT